MAKKKKLLPHKVITKQGRLFFGRLFKRLFQHIIGYLLLITILIAGYFIFKSGVLDTVIKYHGAPKTGTIRKADIDFRQKTAKFSTINSKTGEVYKVHEVVGVRLASIEQFDDGSVKVRARNKGFGFEPGYGVFIVNGRPRVGLDIQWAYWKRLGLSSGAGVGGRKTKEVTDGTGEAKRSDLQWNVYPLALNYNLPFRWTPNTNLFLGYLLQKQATAGVTVKW